MSARIDNTGRVHQLDRPAKVADPITPEQVKDVDRVARMLTELSRDVAELKRQWRPRYIDFEGRKIDDATGAKEFRFVHRFGGAVGWSVIDWTGATTEPRLVRLAKSDEDTLVLVSYATGTVTVRVQEAG